VDFETLLDNAGSFFEVHTFWAILGVAAIGTLIYWKPKGTLKVSAACAVVFAIIFVLSFLVDLTSRGMDEAEKFTSSPQIKVD